MNPGAVIDRCLELGAVPADDVPYPILIGVPEDDGVSDATPDTPELELELEMELETEQLTQRDCSNCGTLRADIDRLNEALVEATLTVQDWQAEATRLLARARRAEAKAEQAPGDRGHSKRDLAIFNLWLEVTGRDAGRHKFTKDRQEAIASIRRAGWEDADMERVIRTGAKYRYLVYGNWRESGSASDVRDDLADMFATGKRFESLLALARSDA